MCAGWGQSEVPAEVSAGGLRKWSSLWSFAASGDVNWKARLITYAQTESHWQKNPVLLFLLLPLAHPRQSAKNSYWSLQSQVTGMSKDSDAFFLHAESYTVLKEHRNYYTMSMVLFIYLFSKWLLYTLIQALHLEEICIHGGKKSFLNVVIEHCPWSVTNWLWKSYPRGLL